MAYMRRPFYVYSSGDEIHIVDLEQSHAREVILPTKIFDALVVMRYAQLEELVTEGKTSGFPVRAWEKYVANEYNGNFGCDALRKKLGLITAMQTVIDEVKKVP